MWIFTDFGFFSIVRDQQVEGNLLVRARTRGHLNAFASRLRTSTVGLHLGAFDDIRCTPGADYLWKMSVPQVDAAVLLAELVADIDYTNFKGRCGQTDAYPSAALHDVWEVMAATQSIPPYERGPEGGAAGRELEDHLVVAWPGKRAKRKARGQA